MIVYFINSIFVVFFSFLARFKEHKGFFFTTLVLLFLFQSLRYDYGNDYKSYFEMFEQIQNNEGTEDRIETGWIFINKIFSPFNFFVLICFVALFSTFVYYKFISVFLSRGYYVLAIFIYYFDANLFLLQLSAIRQSISIDFFLLALVFYAQQKYSYTLLLLLLGVLFHTTALVLIGVVIMFHFYQRTLSNPKKIGILIAFILSFFLAEYFKGFITLVNFYLLNNAYYEYTVVEDVKQTGIFNIVYYIFIMAFLLKYSNIEDNKYRVLFYLMIFGMFFIPIAQSLPLISRVSYYFLPISIVLFPLIIKNISNCIVKTAFIVINIAVISVRLYTFFYSETYGEHYRVYKTIFDFVL
jgi:hypothetical protein